MGGKLEPKKFNYSVLAWDFDEDGFPVINIQQFDPMKITDSNNTTIAKIKYMLPQKKHKYLGHTKAMNGCNHMEYKNLKKLIKEERAFLSTSFLNPYETTIYYKSIYIPKVSFLRGTSSFSRRKLRTIQRPFDQILLQQMGYNQNTSKSITYGLIQDGGIGLKCLYLQQGLENIRQFIRVWRSNDDLGRLLRITMAWCQMSVGVSTPIFENTATDLPHFELVLIQSIRNFLRYIDATIELDNVFIPGRQRELDVHLMDDVLGSSLFSKK